MITVSVQSATMNVLRIHTSLDTGLTTAVARLLAFGQKLSAVALRLATTVILYFKLLLIGNAKRLRLTLVCFVCLTLPALILFV